MKNSNTHILERIQVNQKLAQGLSLPLTIVTAPMGYGKTTAVKAFLQKQEGVVLWITMNNAGNIANSEYFWLLLTKEIFHAFPELAKDLEERGFPSNSAQIFRLLETLKDFTSNLDANIALVIDDYWLIENQEINTLIQRVVSEQIPYLHIVLISRRIPYLPIEELVMKGLCATLDFDDLTFTYADAKNYFKLIGFSDDETVQKQIYEDSRGWIAALYLMSKSFFNGHPIEDLKRMLKVSLFDNYSKPLQEALIKFSYFDTISPKQAAYIFDDYNMAVLLEQLYKDNAFITRDSKNNYKFHQIFLNFLHDEQTKYDFDPQTIYCRAGEWFAMNNDHMMAYHYWKLAGNYQYILGSLEIADISHINSLDRKLIFPIFNTTDRTLWYEYPIATLKYIFLLILYNEKEHASYLLDEFDSYFQIHQHEKYTRNQLLAEAEILRTSLAFNDMELIIEHAKNAYTLLDGKAALLRKRNGVYTYGCPHFSYMYYNQPGTYQELIAKIESGFDYHIKACNGCGAGASPLSRAEYNLETGDFEHVESFALEAQYVSTQYEQTCIQAASMFTMARLYRITGETAKLEQMIINMEQLRQKEKNPLNSDVFDNALGYLYVLMDEVEKLPTWLREDDVTYRFSNYQGTAFNHLVYQMALIRQKKYDVFCNKKYSFLLGFKQFHNQMGIAFFYINYAISLYHTKGLEAAVPELEKALHIAWQDHLLLIFAENAPELLPILESGDFHIEEAFFSELLSICRENSSPKPKSTSSLLSKREMDIMELLQEGANISDIADRLFISQNTVKRHLQNIYRKLDVHNKTLAIKTYCELYKTEPEPDQ